MESHIQQSNTKRFIIEDSITKVTSDGEPHEVLTMVAGLSGLVAAIVILAILISFIGCNKNRRTEKCAGNSTNSCNSQRSSVSTNFTRTTSIADGGGIDDMMTPIDKQQNTISIIYGSGNLEGNLNSAFVGSELSLGGSQYKMAKRQISILKKNNESQTNDDEFAIKETTIDIEKY